MTLYRASTTAPPQQIGIPKIEARTGFSACVGLGILFWLLYSFGAAAFDKPIGGFSVFLFGAALAFIWLTCAPAIVWLVTLPFSLARRRFDPALDFYLRFTWKLRLLSLILPYWVAVSHFSATFARYGIRRGSFADFLINFGPPVLVFLLVDFWGRSRTKATPQRPAEPLPAPGFALHLGTSTGLLATFGHAANLAKGQAVSLSLEDSCQNILVLGGIGSGKTTRAVQPLLFQLLKQDTGGLIFDVKGDFRSAALTLAAEAGRALVLLGPGHTSLNLLEGLPPELAASFLKSAVLLSGSADRDRFWIDTAAELCRNSLGVLSFLDRRYTLTHLHSYLFDKKTRADWNQEALNLLLNMPPDSKKARLLRSYQAYYEDIFSGFDDRIKSGVLASCAQILSPFQHPELIDAFASSPLEPPDSTPYRPLNMEDVLSGSVFLVDLPLSKWGLGAKVAYTLIKLRFFNVLERRRSEPSWDQARPVFFVCDEFQELVSSNKDGLSDLNFWDKSRSSTCIGLVSAQAVSSFYAALGHRDLADALMQNFRQKICFRTEDRETIDRLNHLLGRVEIQRTSYGESSGTSDSWRDSSSHSGTSSTTSIVDREVINPQLFRQLGPNEGLALLSIGGSACDDVLLFQPVFVN